MIFEKEIVHICRDFLKTVEWKESTQCYEITPLIDLNFYKKGGRKIGILVHNNDKLKWTLIFKENTNA